MKKIFLSLVLVLGIAFTAQSQVKNWVYGNLKGVGAFVTGSTTIALSDTANCDTTAATATLYSKVLSNSVNLINKKKVLVGWVVLDTAKAGTTTTAPTAIVSLQGSLDGTTFITVADSILVDKRFYTLSTRTGGFQLGAADLSNYQYPYWRVKLIPSGTLGTASTSTSASQIKVGKFKYVIIPVTN